MSRQELQPPRWANRFLEWYCRPELLEEIQGDAFELFSRQAQQNKQKANWLFVWNVLRFCRLKNIRTRESHYTVNHTSMIKSYFLVGLRNAMRNRLTSFVNVSGLALGVAGAITIFIFADHFFHSDDFHEKKHRIYEVTSVVVKNDTKKILSKVPSPLGAALHHDVASVEEVVSFESEDGAVRYGDKVFSEYVHFVDQAFFKVFNFPFVEGNEQALHSKADIVMTAPIAKKYFGEEGALGKTVSIKFSNEAVREFTVAAVVELPPTNTMYFDFLLPMEAFVDLKFKERDSWASQAEATFILLKPGYEIASVSRAMDTYRKLQNESSPEWVTEEFRFFSLPELTWRSADIENGVIGPGHPQGVLAVGSIALALLLLACLNYMNIAVATVSTRVKEIGIRKVIGGKRKEIARQFIFENLMFCVFSISIGMGVSYFFFLPWLNTLISAKIPFSFSSGASLITLFGGLLAFIVLISGVYPAVYVSGFQPASILKGKEKFGQRSWFSRVLLTTQFVLAFVAIVGCFVYIDNSLYLTERDWGYNPDNNILLPFNTLAQYKALCDQVEANPKVVSYAGAHGHVGYDNTRTVVVRAGEREEVVHYQIGFNYLETMNLRLHSGRFLDKAIQSDWSESVVINQRFARMMKWDEPLGQTFEHEQVRRVVVGVVSDFHFRDFYRDILPVMFTATTEDEFGYLAIQTTEGAAPETEGWLKNKWKDVAPDDPYLGKLQSDVFANFRNNIKADNKILGFIAGVALTLSCLGLFGLVSYNITRRLKEFSIRKIFGANTVHIFRLMSQDYVWILSIAFLVGAPMGFLLMDYVIQHVYADPQSAGPLPFVLAIAMIGSTIALTVATQMKRVVEENPSRTLRND